MKRWVLMAAIAACAPSIAPAPAAPTRDFATHAEVGEAGMKVVAVLDIEHRRILALEREVAELRTRIDLLEKFSDVVRDLLQHERDIGVMK